MSYDVDVGEWANYTDAWGDARIPLRQTYNIRTKQHHFYVNFQSKIEQYFRAPVFVEKDLVQRVFSDFRAVGVKTHIVIKTVSSSGSEQVIFDKEVDTTNALEFAYEPPMNIEKFKSMAGKPLSSLDIDGLGPGTKPLTN